MRRAPAAEGNIIHVVHDHAQADPGLGGIALAARFVPAITSIFRILDASEVPIKEVRIDDLSLEEVVVETYSGVRLLFSLRFGADSALPVLRSLGSKLKNLEYVDFRVENRAYYK